MDITSLSSDSCELLLTDSAADSCGDPVFSDGDLTDCSLSVESFDELEKRKDEIKDKIVFYNYKFNDTYINTFYAYRDAGQYRGQGPSRAAK